MNIMRILPWDYTRFQEGKDNSLSHIMAKTANVPTDLDLNLWKMQGRTMFNTEKAKV